MPVSKIDRLDDGSITPVLHISERNLIMLRKWLECPNDPEFGPQIGKDHVNFFAEVQPGGRSEPDSWFVLGGTGRIFLLNELEDGEAKEIAKRYNAIRIDIENLTQHYAESTDKEKNEISRILSASLVIPDYATSVYAGEFRNEKTKKLYKSPIIINWGFKKRSQLISPSEGLVGPGEGIEFPPKTGNTIGTEPIEPGGSSKPSAPDPILVGTEITTNEKLFSFLWIIAALLIAWIIYILIPACGIKGILQSNGCTVKSEIKTDNSTLLELSDRIQAHEAELIYKRNKCNVDENISADETQSTIKEMPYPPADLAGRLKQENATIGDVNFTMIWQSRLDLDLEVTCPEGQKISYLSGKLHENKCGTLDVDANYKNKQENPIEHILIDNPTVGLYSVQVHLRPNADSSTDHEESFELKIYSGSLNKTSEDKVTVNKPWNYGFNYGGPK